MNQSLQSFPSPRIAIVSSMWHAEIVTRARESLIDELARHGWPPDRVTTVQVPGAFEIPLRAQTLARSGEYAAVVGCGLVVDGGIYRHEFVAAAVIEGLMRVQLDTGVPVFSVVLTPRAFHEHEDHRRFFGDHFVKKGQEAAQACLQVLGVMSERDYLQAFVSV